MRRGDLACGSLVESIGKDDISLAGNDISSPLEESKCLWIKFISIVIVKLLGRQKFTTT